MRRKIIAAVALPLGVATLALGHQALAKRVVGDFGPTVSFQLLGRPLGGAKPAEATAAYLAGQRIAAAGEGALVIDQDSGHLIKTDKANAKVASIAIGKNPGLLAYDPVGKLAYVADRTGNRVAVVKVGDKLEVAASYKTPTEPFGIALSPDRKTVLVTTIADRTLVALDTATGKEKWRSALAREPRGIAVSPDGTRALVAYLTTGTVDQVDLLENHKAEHIALSTQNANRVRNFRGAGGGDAFARGAFTALFMGQNQAVVPFQRETPVQATVGERTGSYGGGFEPPISHQLAFLATSGERTNQLVATIGQHQPRALAWDSAHDALYIAGLGSDTIIQLKNASQVSIAEGLSTSVTSGKERCGPDGVAVGADGNVLVWCSFTRSVEKLEVIDGKGKLAIGAKVKEGPTLIASAMTDKQHTGMVIFHSAQPQVSARGALACASCHPDNRADGLSWRIDKQELQTPVLAGRIVDTHPYKWDGGDPDLKASLASTMKRLGGFGLKKEENEALAAYLEALPKPVAPTRDTTKVARGEKVFDDVGCRSCHDGKQFTDQDKHKFQSATLPQADTPSLIGLAASAPYFHDGSAATLEALLRERGNVHGMAETAKLDDKQLSDLIAFLETL